MEYRSDIDGLRAVAVLAVLLFHVGFESFSGGFVGVDIFFVVSGFLITRLIRHEVTETGTFDFKRFYVNRVGRLFPAMFATVAISLGASALLFPPDLFRDAAASAIASLASVSNIYFWGHAGYFDTESLTKPLLHTWSLAVEEQFYLFWPAVIVSGMLRLGTRGVLLVILCLSMLSLLANFAFENHRDLIFYMLPFRVFEFGIGGALVWAEDRKPNRSIFHEFLFATGLALIAYSVVSYDETIVFPSWHALMPCIGAALAIYAGKARYLGKAIDNKLFIGVGLISYSIYLVHWPLIVGYSYWKLDPFSFVEKVALLGLSILLAIPLFFWIERPMRKLSRRAASLRVLGVSALVGCLVAIPAANAIATNGWVWRYSSDIQSLLDREQFSRGPKALPWQCFMRPGMDYTAINAACYTIGLRDDSAMPNIALVGDSTALAMMPGIVAAFDGVADIYQWTIASCPPIQNFAPPHSAACAKNNAAFFTEILPANRYDLVIFSSHYQWERMVESFPSTIRTLDRLGIPYVLLGQTINFRMATIDLVARHGKFEGLDLFMRDHMGVATCRGENGLDQLVPPERFFSMKAVLCHDGVPRYHDQGSLLHTDNLHLSRLGSLYVAERLRSWMEDNQMLRFARTANSAGYAEPKF